MGLDPKEELISYPILFIFISIYYIALSALIHSYRFTQAIFSRSYLLVTLSSIFNYLETVFILIFNLTIGSYKNPFDSNHAGLAFSIIIFNESFFAINLLKVFRAIHLERLNTGNFRYEKSFLLKKKLSANWNLKIFFMYLAISILPRIILYLICKLGYYSMEIWYLVFQFIQLIEALIESVILVFLAASIVKSNCNMTLRIEYSLYVFFWFILFGFVAQSKFLLYAYCLPIRNLLMMMISTVSIYEHEKNFFLPLPEDLDLDFVLKSQFFVNKIRDHLDRTGELKMKLIFDILLAICIFRDNNQVLEKQIIIEKVKALKEDFPFVGDDLSFYEFEDLFVDLYHEFDENFFQGFMKTGDFYEIHLDYSSL